MCNRHSRVESENGKDVSLTHPGCIDSQSVKTATQGKSKGYDAGKKVNGRKRHLLVDTLGLVISTYVSPADLQDRDGLKQVLNQYFDTGATRLRKLWVDGGYRGEDLKRMGRC